MAFAVGGRQLDDVQAGLQGVHRQRKTGAQHALAIARPYQRPVGQGAVLHVGCRALEDDQRTGRDIWPLDGLLITTNGAWSGTLMGPFVSSEPMSNPSLATTRKRASVPPASEFTSME